MTNKTVVVVFMKLRLFWKRQVNSYRKCMTEGESNDFRTRTGFWRSPTAKKAEVKIQEESRLIET